MNGQPGLMTQKCNFYRYNISILTLTNLRLPVQVFFVMIDEGLMGKEYSFCHLFQYGIMNPNNKNKPNNSLKCTLQGGYIMHTIVFPDIPVPIQGLDDVVLPKMVRVRQNYAKDRIEDIPAHLKQEFAKHDYASAVRGKRIAVTVGSRGIPDNAVIVRSICDQLKEWGAEPFIVPAMGSHGG